MGRSDTVLSDSRADKHEIFSVVRACRRCRFCLAFRRRPRSCEETFPDCRSFFCCGRPFGERRERGVRAAGLAARFIQQAFFRSLQFHAVCFPSERVPSFRLCTKKSAASTTRTAIRFPA